MDMYWSLWPIDIFVLVYIVCRWQVADRSYDEYFTRWSYSLQKNPRQMVLCLIRRGLDKEKYVLNLNLFICLLNCIFQVLSSIMLYIYIYMQLRASLRR